MIEERVNATAPTDDPWEDLVVSMLSVNNYSVERTYRFIDGLRKQGLFNPRKLAGLDESEAASRLREGGYDRGEFMNNLFASRLVSLGQFIKSKGAEACGLGLQTKDRKAIEQLLASVKGVGPTVISNFCILQGIASKR